MDYKKILEQMGKENTKHTTAETAERLGIKRSKVYHLIDEGHLPAMKEGRAWVISEAGILYYINEVKLKDVSGAINRVFGVEKENAS